MDTSEGIQELQIPEGIIRSGVPSLQVLDDLSRKIPHCWMPLGTQLGVEAATLQCIKSNNVQHPSPDEKAFEMLDAWRNEGETFSYENLAKALNHLRQCHLAQEFCEESDKALLSWSQGKKERQSRKRKLDGSSAEEGFHCLIKMRSETSNQDYVEHLQSLKARAMEKGYVFYNNNPKDGNCMFSALADQLQTITHQQLREELVTFLTDDSKLMDGTKLIEYADDFENWLDYLNNMRKDGIWGDHIILRAFANRYKRPVKVISSLKSYEEILITPVLFYDEHNADPVVLGHVAENHYVGLIADDVFHCLIKMTKTSHQDHVEHLQRLKTKTLEKGYVFHNNNPEDGNCMFSALADQLQTLCVYKTHQQLRKELVDYLSGNPKQADGTELFVFTTEYKTWPDYLEEMRKDGTWGDYVILQTFANLYKRPVRVISSHSNCEDTLINPVPCPDDHFDPLVVGHVAANLFVSLIKAKESIRRLQKMRSDQNVEGRAQILKTSALEKGFVFLPNDPKNRNCLSSALAEQLQSIDERITSQELREELVRYISDRPKMADGTELSMFVDTEQPWPDYLAEMTNDGTRGDHLILQAFANSYKRLVRVISGLSNYEETLIIPVPGPDDHVEPLVLGHFAENQYVSLIKAEENLRRLIKMKNEPHQSGQEERLKLETRALDKGYYFLPNDPQNRNCLFSALADQLQTIDERTSSHKLREELVRHISDCPKMADGTELQKFICPEQPWPDYLAEMTNDGTWGDHLILQAFANSYKRPVRVISGLSNYEETLIIPVPGPDDYVEPLVLGHVAENQYVSLIKADDGFRCSTKMITEVRNLGCNQDHCLQTLERKSLGKGYVFRSDTPRDENCMFQALADQLRRVRVYKTDQQLRNDLVGYLTENPKLASGTELIEFADGYETWSNYLENMAQDGTRGDHIILQAFANCYSRPIVVISSLPNFDDILITPIPVRDEDNVDPLVMGHVAEHHYVSLIKVPQGIYNEGEEACKCFLKACTEGPIYATRIPIMLIGQERAGKTSLKKSLKGEKFDPREPNTRGIDVDPLLCKVTTESFKVEESSFEETALPKDATTLTLLPKQQDLVGVLKTVSKVEQNGFTDHNEKAPPKDGTCRQVLSNHTTCEAPAPPMEINKNIGSDEKSLSQGKKMDQMLESDDAQVQTATQITSDLIERFLEQQKLEEGSDIFCTIWDFAGQAVYYTTHTLFLTQEALYVLVHNLNLDPHGETDALVKQGLFTRITDGNLAATNMDFLHFWMTSISSLSRNVNDVYKRCLSLPPAIFVCTHADKPFGNEAPKDQAWKVFDELRRHPYKSHLVERCYVVDNRRLSGDGVDFDDLRTELIQTVQRLPQFREAIPRKWLMFEKALEIARTEGVNFFKRSNARQFAEVCGITDEDELELLLVSLHKHRVVLYFHESADPNPLVVLNPQWLIDVFKRVITVKPFLGETELEEDWRQLEGGILKKKLLEHVWEDLIHEKNTFTELVSIMEKFTLICKWSSTASSEEQYLVPHMLQFCSFEDVENLFSSSSAPSLFVKFKSQNPQILFPHFLVCLIHEWNKQWPGEELPKPHRNYARLYLGSSGSSVALFCHLNSFEVALITPPEVRSVSEVRELCSEVFFVFEEALKHTSSACQWLNAKSYGFYVLCPVCCKGLKRKCKCTLHRNPKCLKEECLHFFSETDVQVSRPTAVCKMQLDASNPLVKMEDISHWFHNSDNDNEHNGHGPRHESKENRLPLLASQANNKRKASAVVPNYPMRLSDHLRALSKQKKDDTEMYKEWYFTRTEVTGKPRTCPCGRQGRRYICHIQNMYTYQRTHVEPTCMELFEENTKQSLKLVHGLLSRGIVGQYQGTAYNEVVDSYDCRFQPRYRFEIQLSTFLWTQMSCLKRHVQYVPIYQKTRGNLEWEIKVLFDVPTPYLERDGYYVLRIKTSRWDARNKTGVTFRVTKCSEWSRD